jgi:hypothetical protein
VGRYEGCCRAEEEAIVTAVLLQLLEQLLELAGAVRVKHCEEGSLWQIRGGNEMMQ